MTEVSNLGTNTSLSGTTYLVGVNALGTGGIPANLQMVEQVFATGLEAQSSLGTVALSGSSLVTVLQDGEIYLATVAEIVAAGGGGGGGGGASPSYFPIVKNAFTAGAWNRPALSSLIWMNQRSSTAAEYAGGPIDVETPNTGLSEAYILGKGPAAAGAFTVIGLVSCDQSFFNSGGYFGLAIGNQASGQAIIAGMYANNNNVYAVSFTGLSSGGGASYNGNIASGGMQFLQTTFWIKWVYDGAGNVTPYYSSNGWRWTVIGGPISVATYLTNPPDIVGVSLASSNPGSMQLWALDFTQP